MRWRCVIALFAMTAIGACGTWREPTSASASSRAGDACDADALPTGGECIAMPDGSRLWFRVAGPRDAPVVAYLHGGPGYNAYAFEKTAGAALERDFRMLYLDQRGCGRSTFDGAPEAYGMQRTIEDLDVLRKRLGVERLALVAHSFGGVVAAEYVRRFPHRVSRVVMVDTTPELGRALDYEVSVIDADAERAFPFKAAEIHRIVREGNEPFTTIQRLYASVGRLPLQRRIHFADAATQRDMEAMDAESALLACTSPKAVSAFRAEGWLEAAPRTPPTPLAVPALLIAGRRSDVIGQENLERAARAWGAELRFIEGAGHFIYFDQTDVFVREVGQFLAER